MHRREPCLPRARLLTVIVDKSELIVKDSFLISDYFLDHSVSFASINCFRSDA